ncbi:MAG TPA: hypothetical protein P5048_05040, partial [Chlamydiales bacterium]|nr:hypothetical protein [Chlamydiales bacterium]
MKKFLKGFIDIPKEDHKKVLYFFLLGAFWAFGISICDTVASSLFLKNIGAESLPINYLVIAICSFGFAYLFLKKLKQIHPSKIFLFFLILVSSIITLLSFALLFHSSFRLILYITPIITFLFDAMLIATYWTFIDKYHDLQDAKNFYCVYNGAYFMGYIGSAITISKFYPIVGPSGLFLFAVVLFIGAMFICKQIIQYIPSIEETHIDGIFQSRKTKLTSWFSLLLKSPFTLCLVFLSLIIQLIRMTTEFSYMSTFEHSLYEKFEHLSSAQIESFIATFISKWKAYIAVANITLGIFLYKKAIKRIGITTMLLIPPLAFVSLYSSWIHVNTLIIAICALICIECILYSIEDNNFNVLMNAAPTALQGSVRIINDSLFEPLGMLISSIFLFTIQSHAKMIGLILSIIALLFVLMLRIFYHNSIYKNLNDHHISFNDQLKTFLKKLSKKETNEIYQDLYKA